MIHRGGDLADLEAEHRAVERSLTEKIYGPLSQHATHTQHCQDLPCLSQGGLLPEKVRDTN